MCIATLPSSAGSLPASNPVREGQSDLARARPSHAPGQRSTATIGVNRHRKCPGLAAAPRRERRRWQRWSSRSPRFKGRGREFDGESPRGLAQRPSTGGATGLRAGPRSGRPWAELTAEGLLAHEMLCAIGDDLHKLRDLKQEDFDSDLTIRSAQGFPNGLPILMPLFPSFLDQSFATA